MIPAVVALLLSLLIAAAMFVRRLIDPACPACAGRDWHGGASELRCQRCGWSTEAQRPAQPQVVDDLEPTQVAA